MRPTFRRLFIAVLPLALAGPLSGCDRVSPVQPTARGVESQLTGSASPASPGAPDLNAGLAAIRAATSAFHDVAAASGAGYLLPDLQACVAGAAGAMGLHAVNGALVADQAIDPLRPEVLLFLPRPGGGVRLVGVEYLQAVLVRDPATGAVQPWFDAGPWPASWQVVNPAPQVLGQTFQGPMAGHEPGMPWHYDLHVWVWAKNPAGDFAQYNPALACPAS